MSSILNEDFNSFDKEVKGMKSIDELNKRIKFWERKKSSSKGKDKVIKECDKYIKYLKTRIEELKKKENENTEKPCEIEVTVDVNQE